MQANDVVIIECDAANCDRCNCQTIQHALLSSTPFKVEVVTTLTAGLMAGGLIVLRCCTAEALQSLQRLSKSLNCLGVFCPSTGSSQAFCPEKLDDFIYCPFSSTELISRIRRLLPEHSKIDDCPEGRRIREQFHLHSLVGETRDLLDLVAKLPRIANSEATCLLSGETGTGKELLARAIHYISPRSSKPFVPVNCGALPEQLFENELFGHARGAFTDAHSEEPGLIAVAERGTLFLDEVDALSPGAQVKLLRFLQDREYRRVGSTLPVVANVRVVAATNCNLRLQVDAGLFRKDLFHRLNVLNVHVSALRERKEDIHILASHFVRKYAGQHPGQAASLSPKALQKLLAYSWPGNVRELETVIQRAVIMSSSRVLQASDIELPIHPPDEPPTFRIAKRRAIDAFERSFVTSVLALHDGNVSHAAKAVGKERRAFQRLMQKHSVSRSNFSKAG